MNRTAWVKKGSSSLPSDRIPPKVQPQAAPSASKAKGKQKAETAPPKSKEVRKLEKQRDDLRKSSGLDKDPKGGCFCQARMHALSPFTPICRACGLILCELNLPNFACPHCGGALLTQAAKDSLVESLETRITETLAKEEEERQRAIQQARSAEGAFPTLSAAASRAGTPGPDPQGIHPVNQTHKVLSLDSKTRKVKVSSYTPPAVSRTASTEKIAKAKEAEPEYVRVPAPPAEVVCSPAPSAHRPWANTRGLNVTYVPPSRG
ncbi:uncharacterized protein TRAVEDRAFT_58921 [Trametes versicolor FP-101664 SS1]|uniref:uncharacterized protein n=1 Tax=Trametes versicolor (strain FP-101664) TaxID=717944 RepID=UPI0004621B9A|nr:uncharacterized protein TRAVEDRAFT_58921 [Trametes versicolor FP-101664 SS1]EIW58826.1 hypothetical protein TRAVEDRAFT_58921 [Trametes versicolor FP-101664 SS1]